MFPKAFKAPPASSLDLEDLLSRVQAAGLATAAAG